MNSACEAEISYYSHLMSYSQVVVHLLLGVLDDALEDGRIWAACICVPVLIVVGIDDVRLALTAIASVVFASLYVLTLKIRFLI